MKTIFKNISPKTLILALLLLNAVLSSSPTCLNVRGEERQIIDAREMLNTEQNIMNCMKMSIREGRTGQTRSIIDLFDQKYAEKMADILEKQLDRLEIIEEQIILSEGKCSPVMKWSQNISHLFISMKMSHRWDSPPCLHTKSQTAHLTNTSFEYINVCLVSNQRVTFRTEINFYYDVKEIPVQSIKVIKDGVGTYAVTVEKGEEKVWPFLDKNEVVYASWGEIDDRYNPIHKQYVDLLDQIMRDKQSKPSIVEPKKKKQVKVEGNQSENHEEEAVKTEVGEVQKQEDAQNKQNSGNADAQPQIVESNNELKESQNAEKVVDNPEQNQQPSEL